jgi:hypothetical protein
MNLVQSSLAPATQRRKFASFAKETTIDAIPRAMMRRIAPLPN